MAEYEAGLWEVDYSHAAADVFDGVETDEALAQLQADAENVAVNILWNFTNRMFGTRQLTIRPQQALKVALPTTFEGRGPYAGYPAGRRGFFQPVMIEGLWYNIGCGTCVGGCSCLKPWTLELPGNPVEITSININGEVMPASEYWLDGNKLIRSEGTWPTEQNMRLPAGNPGTWSIEYTAGIPVPRGGQIAAGILATELAKAALSDDSCVLPERVQTITRQGITMALIDSFEDLSKGRVGIPRVDMWIQSVNVPRSAATLMSSPDYRR